MNRQEKKKQAELHNIIYENRKNKVYMLAFCEYMERLCYAENEKQYSALSKEEKREAVKRAVLMSLAATTYYR